MDQRHPDPSPDEFVPVVAFADSFDARYGLELLDDDRDGGTVRGRARVTDDLRQQFGLLHGGVIAAMAESLASHGTWFGVRGQSKVVMGLSNETNFLRPITSGHLNQLAEVRRRGRTRWLWEVQSSDDDQRLCAITMVNIAVRDFPVG
ncbi:MAG TPA: PaaI family thioesterase [Solirubrobacteraceae bacterium]|jgi:uncharacterized protein (TIGR00369 family)